MIMKVKTMKNASINEQENLLNEIVSKLKFSKNRVSRFLSSFLDEISNVKIFENKINIKLVRFRSEIEIKFEIHNNIEFKYLNIRLNQNDALNFDDSIRLGILYGDFIKNFCNISFLLEKKLLAINILQKRIAICKETIKEIEQEILQETFENNALELIQHIEYATFIKNEQNILNDDLKVFCEEILGDWTELKICGFFNHKRKTVDIIITKNGEKNKERIKRDNLLYVLGSGILNIKKTTIEDL